jgi:two-component system cell cycle sensor histidine kinase/response regulator CckA
LGWDREELLGRTAADLVAKGDPALNLTAAAAARQAGRLLRKDGGTVMVEIGSRILRDGRAQLIVRDIGERMALEQQLRQAQKMDAVGRLAGGVAHDFNNLLTAILGYGEFALNELDPDTDLHGNVEEMMAAANRAALLTSQLLALSRRQTMQPKIVDINMAATNLGKLIQRVIGENIELVINLGRDIKPVKVDSGQIEQVILNLAINARDAMQQGGKLIIETSNVELDEEYSRTHVNFKAGTYVIVAVSDTGVGMSQEVLAQIFEPFFTTKEAGKGTGLGLSIAYGIVAQSGGHIQAYSEPGYGSTFRIYLPVTAETAETAPKRRRGEGMPRGTETILLVEDDQVVRNIVRTLLKGAGYVVFEAPNGADAIHIADDYGDTIHLLLTDIIMPGMNGKALAENLLSKRPGMRVIFASGYAEDVIVHYGILDPGIAFMQKPFTSRTLVSKVREVLDAPVGETRLSSAQ